MGLPRLARTLAPFAVPSTLKGRAIIDGPALAYHILDICRQSKHITSPQDEPTCSNLGQTAIEWLDKIGTYGVNVSAIYFDGYLPRFKKTERLQRLWKNSKVSNRYFLATVPGIPAESTTIKVRKRMQNSGGQYQMPHPPFVVPAILDSLRLSERYGNITILCPGEADSFCSDDLKRHGGTVITGDSDMLAYDLGEGSVVFLKDLHMDITDASSTLDSDVETIGLTALIYTPSAICEKLSLPSKHGLISFAFEVLMDPHLHKDLWAKRSRQQHSITAHPAEYEDFLSQYSRSPGLDSLVPGQFSSLDPRISEFILQWTGNVAYTEPVVADETTAANSIFLPMILDRWDRASAWDVSTSIRRLAYTLLQSFSRTPQTKTVVEYRRTLSRVSSGLKIEISDETNAVEACSQFLSLAEAFNVDSSSSILQWLTLCIYQETAHAAQQEEESLALKLWQKASESQGQLDPGDWDTIHFTAQLQGMLYSLRILSQILISLGHVAEDVLREVVDKVKECLSSLPSIMEFPTIGSTKDLFKKLRESGALDFLTDVAMLDPIPFREPLKTTKSRGKKMDCSARQWSTGTSTNPFDVLEAS